MVNANYIMDALGKFLKIYKQKRPKVAFLEQFFHWDNAPVHTAAVLKDWMAVKQFQVIEHPLYSPDLAPADFFLFPEIKKQLTGKSLTQQSFKKEWEGAARNLTADDFSSYAFRRWMNIGRSASESGVAMLKNVKNTFCPMYYRLSFI